MNTNPIIGQFLTTTPIIYSNGNHATGFFFRYYETTYLVTNKHAVDFVTENGNKLQTAKVRIRDNPTELDEFGEYTLSLREERKGEDRTTEPHWLNNNPRIDLALIPLAPPVVDNPIDILPPREVGNTDGYEYGNLAFQPRHFPERTPMKMTISGGSGALILGYPLEYFGPSLPVGRNAIVSSPYGRSIEDLVGTPADIPKKAFLTDAVTHPGLSGSPVITKPPSSIMQNPDRPENIYKATTLMEFDNKMALLGIHAGEFDQYSDLQLNHAVYPSAITDMLESVKSDEDLG